MEKYEKPMFEEDYMILPHDVWEKLKMACLGCTCTSCYGCT